MGLLASILRSVKPTFAGLPAGGVVPASQAVLCCNCDYITTPVQGRCLRCQSESVLNLSEIINRTPEQRFALEVLSVFQEAGAEGVR